MKLFLRFKVGKSRIEKSNIVRVYAEITYCRRHEVMHILSPEYSVTDES